MAITMSSEETCHSSKPIQAERYPGERNPGRIYSFSHDQQERAAQKVDNCN